MIEGLIFEPPPGTPIGETAFVTYTAAADVNWSEELERLHIDSSRDHFLDVLTRQTLLGSVRASVPDNGVVLDVGCSSGHLLEDFAQSFPNTQLLGLDLVAAGLRRAHASVPTAKLLLADACAVPVRDGACDAVVSANLLEHVRDDTGALAEMWRVLRPGGRAAIIVPAGPGMYDYYDKFLSHERRYRRGELADKARSAGFVVRQDAFIGSFIFPAFWTVKKLNRLRHRNLSDTGVRELVERDIRRTTSSRLGAATAQLERQMLSRGKTLPFGIRSLVVAERPRR
jgi:ubiquinone/menaquinone biosynthesis C-methylase UbiE